MRENLSARGSLDDWIEASEEALWNAGFDPVELDKHFDRIAADIGDSGYIDINFLIQNDGRVRLEIEASDPATLSLFKTEVARVMGKRGSALDSRSRNSQNISRTRNEELSDSEGGRGNKGQRGKKGRSGNRGLRLPGSGKRSADPFYSRSWFVLLMLIILPPLGIFLLFYFKKFRILPRIILTVIAVLYTLLIWLGLFGINTEINQETINSWIQNGQSQITRLLNEQKNNTPSPSAAPSATTNSNSNDSDAASGESMDNSNDSSSGGSSNLINDALNSLIPSPTATGEDE